MSSGLVLKAGLSTSVQRMSKRGMFNAGQSQKRAVQSLSWESYVRDELSVIDEDPPLLLKRPQLHSLSLHDLRASATDADRVFHDDKNDEDEDADEIGDELLLPAVERRPSAKIHMAAFVQRYRARLPRAIAKREKAKELIRRRFSQLPPEPLPILHSKPTYRNRSSSEGCLSVPLDSDSISTLNKAISSNRSNAIKASPDGNDSEKLPDCNRRSDIGIDSEPDSSASRNRSATNNYLEEVSDNLQRVMDAFERRTRERAALLTKSLGPKNPTRANPSTNRAGPTTTAATKSNPPSTSTNAPTHAATRAPGSTDAALFARCTSNSTNSTKLSNGLQTRKQGTAVAPEPGFLRLNILRDAPDAAEGSGGGNTRRMSKRANRKGDYSRSPYSFADRSSNRWRLSIASEPSQQTKGVGVGENLATGEQKQQCEYEARLVAGLSVQYVRPLLHKTPRASDGGTSEGAAHVRVCSRLADLINGRPNPGVGGGRGAAGPLVGSIEPPLVTGRAICRSARAAGGGGAGGSEKRKRSPSVPPAAAAASAEAVAATASSRTDSGATAGADANLRQRDYELLRWLVKDQHSPVAQRH